MNTERRKSWLSSSSKLVATSAQLAKKQAELATLNNVTLPRLYHAIGKRLIGSASLPLDLLPHRETIRDLEAAIAAKPEEQKSEPASGFAAKAKRLAQQAASKTAKATADAAATVKIQAAYVALGKQAIEKYGPQALPTDLREHYEAGIHKQANLGSEITALKGDSGKGFVTPGRLIVLAIALPVLVVGFLSLRSPSHLGADYRVSPASDDLVRDNAKATSSSEPFIKESEADAAIDESPQPRLASYIVRVPRNNEPDPGWGIQVLHRIMRTDHLDEDSPVGRMLDAYQRGHGEWQNADGSTQSIWSLGLPRSNWSTMLAVPPWRSKVADDEPHIHVKKEAKGTRVLLSPTEITDDLLCSISFLVIDNKASANAKAKELDFLATQIELYGGKRFQLTTSPHIRGDTFVDLWAARKQKRYTVSRWRKEAVGHMTVQTYAPLLFEVLDNGPDFMLIENVKIELGPRFRKGCRLLCDKVLELREAQGQAEKPVCRKP